MSLRILMTISDPYISFFETNSEANEYTYEIIPHVLDHGYTIRDGNDTCPYPGGMKIGGFVIETMESP